MPPPSSVLVRGAPAEAEEACAPENREDEAWNRERDALAQEVAEARQHLARLTEEIAAAEARHAQVAESTLAARLRRDTLAGEVIALYSERADLLEQVSSLRIAVIRLDPGHIPMHPAPPAPWLIIEPVARPAPPEPAPKPPVVSFPLPTPPATPVAVADGGAWRRGILRSPSHRDVATWSARGQTTAKPRNDSFDSGAHMVWRRNEDRWRLSETATGLLAAVADGAGASGLYCGAWAETLVGRLPDTAIADILELNDWLEGFCLEFRAAIIAQCKANPPKHSKFVREGSCATLVGCWVVAHEDGAALHWLGYGDSPLLVFDRTPPEPVLIHSHPGSLAAFARDPHLLNWKTMAEPAWLRSGVFPLPPRATLLLASDGMGQYILLRHLAALSAAMVSGAAEPMLGEFRELTQGKESRLTAQAKAHAAAAPHGGAQALTALGAALATEDAFAALVAAHCADNLLANDDSTLIMIDIEHAPAALAAHGSNPCGGSS